MNYIYFIGYFLSIFSTVFAAIKGHTNSIELESDVKPFNLTEIKNLVIFGDSYSAKHIGKNWPVPFLENKKIKDWNFAIGGAVIDNNIVPRNTYNSSFLIQNQEFIDKMSKGKVDGDKWNKNDTLFTYWYGTNDILYLDREKYNTVDLLEKVLDLIVSTLFGKLDETYDIGARNFLFFKVIDLSALPYYTERYKKNQLEEIKNICNIFNDNIVNNAWEFHNKHPDTNVFVYNSDEELEYIIENYKTYNFINCNDNKLDHPDESSDKFIWKDKYHPTEKTYRIMTNDLEYLLTGIEQPISALISVNGDVKNIILQSTKILISILFVISLLY